MTTRKLRRLQLVADLIVFIAIAAAAGYSFAQPGVNQNGVCTLDPLTGDTICTGADGRQYRYSTKVTGTGAPSTYRQGATSDQRGASGVPAQFVCCDGGNCRQAFAEWRRWADHVENRLNELDGIKQNKGEYTTPSALDQYAKKSDLPKLPANPVGEGYVEGRLQKFGAVIDDRLKQTRTDAEQLAAKTLAAAKEDAARLVPGILDAAKKDAAERIKNTAPTLLATLTELVDARLQNVSVVGAGAAVAGFGLKHLLWAGAAGATGTLPAFLVLKFLGWGFRRLKTAAKPPGGPGGPRPNPFPRS